MRKKKLNVVIGNIDRDTVFRFCSANQSSLKPALSKHEKMVQLVEKYFHLQLFNCLILYGLGEEGSLDESITK